MNPSPTRPQENSPRKHIEVLLEDRQHLQSTVERLRTALSKACAPGVLPEHSDAIQAALITSYTSLEDSRALDAEDATE